MANKPLEKAYVRLNSTGCHEKFCINLKLLKQLRGQCHFIRCHIPELQFLQDFRTKGSEGEFIWRMPVRFSAGRVVHMVNCPAYIPLCKVLKHSAFGKDHPQHRMDIFNAAFLAAAHGVTVENTCPCLSVPVMFRQLRVSGLTAPVGEYDREYTGKFGSISKRILDFVKLRFYGALRTAVHQPAYKEFHVGKIQSQDAFV